ncbi:hypothetical protein RRG08_025368 [Elysia crispata]|uniref:Uncharacterized protein n=1 Tax=Elysia crispata TaxID=231223 RepID=A0AAE1EBC6_9GAST|nr:hypothetical protein RRG08_025368 [Elysia crispata]
MFRREPSSFTLPICIAEHSRFPVKALRAVPDARPSQVQTLAMKKRYEAERSSVFKYRDEYCLLGSMERNLKEFHSKTLTGRHVAFTSPVPATSKFLIWTACCFQS